MFIIALLTPGERINYMPGRFPDLPGKRPSRPDADSGVSMLSFYNGLHSSGHCSGFAPDSLLYDNRKSSYHLSGGKDRKLFNTMNTKNSPEQKSRAILYCGKYGVYRSESFSLFNNILPGLNFTLVRGSISQDLPVRGLRPMRLVCFQGWSVPKPCMTIVSPSAKCSPRISRHPFRMRWHSY